MYLARVIGTKVLPNEPVPPVIRMEELVSMGWGMRLTNHTPDYSAEITFSRKLELNKADTQVMT